MKKIKYLVAGLLMMGLSVPGMAQNANYNDLLKPIEQTLKSNPNLDAKGLKELTKDYQKEFKKDPKALVALGNTLLMSKKYDDASAIGNMVIGKFKNCGDAYVLLGDVAAMKDDGGDAAMWYQQSMTMDPKNPNGYMRYANVYRKRSPEESERALNLLKQVRPDYPIEAEAGNNFYLGGNYAKAYEYFSKTQKESLDQYYLVAYAVSAYMDNKKDESLEIAKFGTQKFAQNITFDRVALWSAVDTQKFDDAITYANKIITTDSVEKSARDYIYYGLALKGNKQYQQAIDQYNKAFEMEKNNFKPYQYIADAYAEMGQEDKALEYSEKYMANNQDATPSDYAKLANIYIQKAAKGDANKQANLDKAYSIYDQMAVKWPTIAAWVNNMAGMQASKAGQDDKSVEYFNKVVSLLGNKENREEDDTNTLKSALANLGYYYWITKQNLDAAKPIYEQLIKLDPNDKNARAALGLDKPEEVNK
ncbi:MULTISPECIES: tetratricopeptide repeat protein [Prevotella]|uniref:Tetratricopeptide repeat protein n=1 Tax=Prevotella herbatica TaxID=2801997 RepID=A0ABM7NYY1_9BACT|nr:MULTISPECIES: hypothetical protein [Prevotella]MDN5553851.1 hypothetical protein [Prevotella sp.]BCS85703.1 hypothetical protein prwr041_15960 [Prevotella herbatica]